MKINKYKKKMEFFGTAIKSLKQAAKINHTLSACILILTLARYTIQLKYGLKSLC